MPAPSVVGALTVRRQCPPEVRSRERGDRFAETHLFHGGGEALEGGGEVGQLIVIVRTVGVVPAHRNEEHLSFELSSLMACDHACNGVELIVDRRNVVAIGACHEPAGAVEHLGRLAAAFNGVQIAAL